MSLRRRVALPAWLLAAAVPLVHCATAPQPAAPPASTTSSSVTTATSLSSSPSASRPPAAAAAQPVTAADLGTTWRPECPVQPQQLRRVEVGYVGFDGQTHRGALVVHEDLVPDVIAIFGQLQRLGYPVDKMRTVDNYSDADDELSMEDNNTSAFNCRRIPGSGDWSPHAYGRAIDINPLINPCLYTSGYFEPQNAAVYLDRGRTDPGLLHDGDPAERAFTDRGWQWGGYWRTPDYQHFERP
ncbi:M15 family metallopeptidase [Mycobacterium vicinigordonae]|uniref:M15 family metallopeptidase n=1 Tax=Mycobacterium vicinigordonae TaxID=1719132 RepID=A0A7D6HZM8_9MYCO|nr:M15 family metallopeptidase [Mycobacterium vicinigordonae]QLL08775.1 M15 family metallopeptidase [Mycobacterium vicinigordonae]